MFFILQLPTHAYLSENGGLRTLNSTPLMMMSKPRPHITLNPYSTQLVDNLNMMMPNTSNSSNSNSSASTNSTSLGPNQNMSPQLMNLTNTLRRTDQTPTGEDVIYRSVSPHGHVYWEIEPHRRPGQQPLEDPYGSRQSSRYSDNHPLISDGSSPAHPSVLVNPFADVQMISQTIPHIGLLYHGSN